MYTATNLLLQLKESEVREAEVKKEAMATKLGDFEMASQVWRREENTYCVAPMIVKAGEEPGDEITGEHVV